MHEEVAYSLSHHLLMTESLRHKRNKCINAWQKCKVQDGLEPWQKCNVQAGFEPGTPGQKPIPQPLSLREFSLI